MGITEGSGSHNLKETLITWLLMSDQSDEMEETSRPHPIVCRWTLFNGQMFAAICYLVVIYVFDCDCKYRDIPYNLTANILVSLTLKDTTAGLKFLQGSVGVER